jgi:chaperone required for assembly of F1-ATPase
MLLTMSDETPDDRMRRLVTGHEDRPLPRKFYTEVTLSDDNVVLLDGHTVKTPMKAVLRLPTRALAEAVAAEWRAQDKVINPGRMPLTKFANTAIDRAVSERQVVLDDFTAYVGSDLVCYRAEKPKSLTDAQSAHWDSIIDHVANRVGHRFKTAIGIVHIQQDEAALAAVRDLAAALDPYRLTVLYNLTTLTGSALLSLMLVEGAMSPEAGWLAAHVDEDYQIAEWGEDDEAKARRDGRRRDYDALLTILRHLQA